MIVMLSGFSIQPALLELFLARPVEYLRHLGIFDELSDAVVWLQ
jgi:hypothetical protein